MLIFTNYFIIKLMSEQVTNHNYSLEELLNEDLMPFQNPVCKETYDSLPRIYGTRKKKKNVNRDAHKLKNIDLLDFEGGSKDKDHKPNLSRYLFAGKVAYNNKMHKTRRYLTEHYIPGAEEKQEEKSTSHSIKKQYQALEPILPQSKAFALDDLESSHKVLNPSSSQAKINFRHDKSELEKYINESRARLNSIKIPETYKQPKNPHLHAHPHIHPHARPHARFNTTNNTKIIEEKKKGIKKTEQKVSKTSVTEEDSKNKKQKRYSADEEIIQETEQDMNDTRSKMMRRKKKLSRLSIIANVNNVQIKDNSKNKLSASVLNGLKDEQTIFKSLSKSNHNKSRGSSRGSVLSNGCFKVPKQDQYQRFIQKYNNQNQQFNIKELFNSPDFRIIKEEKSVYFGEVNQDNQRTGQGVLVSEKQIFQGLFNKDEKVKGYQRTMDGVYIGDFHNGLRHGTGEFKWNNGEVFTGNWENGMKNGYGKWKAPQGHFYEGEWQRNKQHGFGVYKHKVSIYEGQFKEFLKHGSGTEKFLNGDKYVGQYKEGKPHGKGTYTWHSGGKYTGDFSEGLRNGEGVWEDEKGNIYTGEFKQDSKHGKGREIYESGEVFEGTFAMGNRKKGTLKKRNGQEIQIFEK